MASPTERADKVREQFAKQAANDHYHRVHLLAALLPPGSLVVTPEDIRAGWRVLTPEQAETVRQGVSADVHPEGDQDEWIEYYGKKDAALALLAGVPGKDSGGNITCDACGAVVAWEGEPPEDCLKCGATVSSDT